MPGPLLRFAAVAYLVIQSVALIAYWVVLWSRPDARKPFLVPGAPDATVMAFTAGDLLLYAASSIACAVGVIRRARWLAASLWLHCGAAMYAALYALNLALLVNDRWLGAAMMAPALVVPPMLIWLFRSRTGVA